MLVGCTGLRSLVLARLEYGDDEMDTTHKISQIPSLPLSTLEMRLYSPASYRLFNHLAATGTITDLKLHVGDDGNNSTDAFASALALLAPKIVSLHVHTLQEPSPLDAIFPLLAKCQSLHVQQFNCANLVGMQYLPVLRELELGYLDWDAEETLIPFLKGRTKKLEKLRMVVSVSHEDCHSMEEAEDQYFELLKVGRDSADYFNWDIEMGVSDL